MQDTQFRDVDAFLKALLEAERAILGMPLSFHEVMASFVLYGALLIHGHNLDDVELQRLIEISKKTKLQIQKAMKGIAN